MKTFKYLLLLSIAIVFTSCDSYETYAEKKETERDVISAYMNSINAKIITENEFKEKIKNNPNYSGVADNEWVLLQKSSVYMQVKCLGLFYEDDGTTLLDKTLKDGESKTVLCRFSEMNLMTNSITLTNYTADALSIPETMSVTRSSDTYTGSFIYGKSLMYANYESASVPTGWLVPMPYLHISRCGTINDKLASVKLIVPHSQGHAAASSYVYPFLYEITYQEGK